MGMQPSLDAWLAQTKVASPLLAQNGNTAWAQRYSQELREVVVRYADRLPRNVQRHLGPSELGHHCDRQLVGKMAGVSLARGDSNNLHDPWASIVGTAIHAFLEEAFKWEEKRLLEEFAFARRWFTEKKVVPDPQSASPHPGTADLYDAKTFTLNDHKCQSEGVRDKLRRHGPPHHYFMQMLLYAVGYMHEGYEVQRVCLVSWPRTHSSLDDLYVWEHVITPEDMDLVVELIRKTDIREQLAALVRSGEAGLFEIPATPSDDDCQYCLTGDTKVVTRDGIKPIAELAGTSPELIVPVRGGVGKFEAHPVRYLGEQGTFEIKLTRNRAVKIVRATAEHRWITETRSHGKWKQNTVTTRDLTPGTSLATLKAAASEPALMEVAVAQGFVFGDGTKGNDKLQPASLNVYDNEKDAAMLKFFPGDHKFYEGLHQYTYVSHLPRFWKELPPIRESRSFLLSWLAGYFAADGCVSAEGQSEISSASRDNLEFVRDIAAVCGIGYGQVRIKTRVGIHASEATDLYSLTLTTRDLPSWFFLIESHATRVATLKETYAKSPLRWHVVSVTPTGMKEPVYCAAVEGSETFALADGLATKNCPFFRPDAAYNPKIHGCPGTEGIKNSHPLVTRT